MSEDQPLVPQIIDGEKYALIALPRLPTNLPELAHGKQVSNGLWFTTRLPFKLNRHWRESIGTLRVEQIEGAQLILLAKCASQALDILDGENQHLLGLVGRFYQGLLLAAPIWVEGDAVQISGANRGGAIDARQIGNITPPGRFHYGQIGLIGATALNTAAELVPILNGFPAGTYRRLCRVLNIYFSGIAQNDVRERLHQFCRCIEGLIFAEPGKTTSQFKSRTELFVGTRQHDFMGSLYLNRSAVEHMNDPILASTSEKVRSDEFLKMTRLAEGIARHCIRNILLKPSLRQHYFDEASLGAFWALGDSERAALWGSALDLAAL
jgi:hypothetical protein